MKKFHENTKKGKKVFPSPFQYITLPKKNCDIDKINKSTPIATAASEVALNKRVLKNACRYSKRRMNKTCVTSNKITAAVKEKVMMLPSPKNNIVNSPNPKL